MCSGRRRLTASDSEAAIRAVLHAQVEAWNHHDLEGSWTGYWNSPELTFFSGTTETTGWQPTLERYRRSYQAEGRAMGTLCSATCTSKCWATMLPSSAASFSWSCLTASSPWSIHADLPQVSRGLAHHSRPHLLGVSNGCKSAGIFAGTIQHATTVRQNCLTPRGCRIHSSRHRTSQFR